MYTHIHRNGEEKCRLKIVELGGLRPVVELLKCACIHMCMLIYMHAYIHTYMHAYIHTCIHTYINIHIYTYIHRNGEEKCRLKIVELGGLRPIVELLKSEVLEVAGNACYTLACLALDAHVRLAIHILGGVQYLLVLMKVGVCVCVCVCVCVYVYVYVYVYGYVCI